LKENTNFVLELENRGSLNENGKYLEFKTRGSLSENLIWWNIKNRGYLPKKSDV
jgi:hypothetical protein